MSRRSHSMSSRIPSCSRCPCASFLPDPLFVAVVIDWDGSVVLVGASL